MKLAATLDCPQDLLTTTANPLDTNKRILGEASASIAMTISHTKQKLG